LCTKGLVMYKMEKIISGTDSTASHCAQVPFLHTKVSCGQRFTLYAQKTRGNRGEK